MNIPWDDLRLVLAIAEAGSLSGAAKALQQGQPTISRRLSALEHQLGTALFLRQPGGVALTVAGERLLPGARKMAEFAAEATRAYEASDGRPQGLVRVTASPSMCFEFLAPFAGFLAAREPGLQLEVLSSIQYLDLARGEADLAIRFRGGKPHPEVTVVTTVTLESAVFVSPALAARLPKKPGLADVPWIGWAPPLESIPPQPQLEAAIPGFRPVFTSDNYLVHFAAAQAGVGAILLQKTRHRFLRDRGLVSLPIDLGPWKTLEVSLMCAKSALDVPRIRTVAHLLAKELELLQRP
jgi:DNA-binding transcriptional LysR family regulator